MINVEELKTKIIEFLKENGPSLPIKIAKAIEKEPVFTSALLGELTSSQKVRASHMRVGSSQIFYLKGQEPMLEPFAEQYLSGMVKKAFLLLKENKFLVDSEQEPAIRVALRSLKDFATIFQYKDKVMWRYNFIPKEEILDLIEGKKSKEDMGSEEEILNNNTRETEDKQNQNEAILSSSVEEKQEYQENNKESLNLTEISKSEEKENFDSPFEKDNSKPEKHEKPKSELSEEVKSFLKKRAFPLVEILEESRTEFIGIVKINSELGAIEFLTIAKSKKSLNDEDIRYCKSRAIDKNMPCLILYKDKITKAGLNILEDFKNLVRAEKLT